MISILTVNYHSGSQLAELVGSIREYPPTGGWEVVVTNNSPVEQLDSTGNGEGVSVIDAQNVGFAAGINLAFRRSRGDVLMIANPDVRVTRGSLDRAITSLREMPEVGLILPLLRYPDGGVQPSVRRFYTWPVVCYARSPMRWIGWRPEFFRRYLYEELDGSKAADVDWGLGGAMFLRRSDVEREAVFDERFFLYFEDVDLCLRTWRRGRIVRYLPDVELIHAHRRSSKNPFSAAGWHHFSSMMRFILKHQGLPQRP